MSGALCGLDITACLARAAPDLDRAAVAELLVAGEGGAVAAANERAEGETLSNVAGCARII